MEKQDSTKDNRVTIQTHDSEYKLASVTSDISELVTKLFYIDSILKGTAA